MASLIPYPPQPFYYLRPEMVALLQAASARRGVTLLLYTGDPRGRLSAWRSYAQQDLLWRASQHGGATASRPDSGPRSHMRGTAADIVLTDAATQNACRAVGLIRDPSESWHWNLPGYLNYPIIPNLAAAGVGSVALLTEVDTMSTVIVSITDNGLINGANPRWYLWNMATDVVSGKLPQAEAAWYGTFLPNPVTTDAGLATQRAKYGAVLKDAVGVGGPVTVPPIGQADREAIAAEVIRQQKLPGN